MSNIRSVTRFALPVAAAGLFGFAVVSSLRPGRAQNEPLLPPQTTSYAAAVAGVGVVEPSSDLIAVASELPGVVRTVHVAAGDTVKKGAPLFTLDSRALQAQLESARAAVSQADAALEAAKIGLEDERQRLSLFEAVSDKRAISEDELSRRRFAAQRAEINVEQAAASLQAAKAQAKIIATDLDRLTVRAPLEGQVWRINVRGGEFAAAGPAAEPLLTMGASGPLHVRVEIDEADIGRVQPGAKAEGALRGAADKKIPLRFVRFEPEAVEKRALSGGAERVDTRVIEVLYAFDKASAASPVFVGQRMDVFIESKPLSVAAGDARGRS